MGIKTERINKTGQIKTYYVVFDDKTKEVLLKTRSLTEAANRQYKENARVNIRALKDIEDDLADVKQTVQFMARGFAGLWSSLPGDIKNANPYKENFDTFSSAVISTNMRLDLEQDQTAKITKILQDEEQIATIVNDEYLSKKG
jgi:hypothetical protein